MVILIVGREIKNFRPEVISEFSSLCYRNTGAYEPELQLA
jgi:hypothetical protein